MKKKRFSLIVCFATLLALAPSLRAQAVYTATRSTRIEAGAGVSLIQPDAFDKNIYGASVWGDYDFSKWIGAEFDVHISAITPEDYAENSYMVGVRGLYHYRKYTGYLKGLVGEASIVPQDLLSSYYHIPTKTYNAFALGGGVEYKVHPKINIRGDFELQQWPNYEPHTLSPLIVTIGASYIIR